MKKLLKLLKNKHWLALSLIVVFAFIIRVINLNWGISESMDTWSSYPDEPYGYEAAVNFKPFSNQFSTGDWSLIKGTFYYELIGTTNELLEALHLKQAIFNTELTQPYHTYLTARTTTIFISLAMIVMIYFFAILLFKNKNIGLLAALTYAIFAHEIPFSRLIIGDTLTALLSFTTLYFCIKAYKTKNNKPLIYAGIFSALATGAKYTAILTALPVFITFLLLHFPLKSLTTAVKNAALIFFPWLISVLIAVPALIFNTDAFLKGLEIQKAYQTGSFAPGENQLPQFIFYFSNVMLHGIGLVFTILALISISYYIYKNRKKSKKEILILFSYLLPYYFVISTATWITTRYTLPLMPFFALLIGYFLVDFYKNSHHKKLTLAIFGLLYVYNLLFLYNFVDALNQPEVQTQFTQYNEETLQLNQQTADIVFVVGYLDGFTHPVDVKYPAGALFLKDIQQNPQIEIPVKYLLISSYNMRDARRINDTQMIAFLDRLEKTGEYKLIQTFEKKPKLPGLFGKNIYYTADLEIFFQKYYLYEKVAPQVLPTTTPTPPLPVPEASAQGL